MFIVVCIIVNASIPSSCGCGTHGEEEESEEQVDISGVYQLEEVENYEEYLLAMDIHPAAVRHIKMLK